MFFKAKRFVGLALTAAFLGAPGVVLATTIDGSVTFWDGFNTTATSTSIVSQLNVMDVNGNANAEACTGAYGAGCSSNGNYALVFDITLGTAQLVFDYNGFHFTATSFSAPTRTGLTCDKSGNCSDAISFTATGNVTATGFDATPFFMEWSASGTCSQNVINLPMLDCGEGTISAGWRANIRSGPDVVALLVPEPGTLALIGVAFIGLGFAVARRRRR